MHSLWQDYTPSSDYGHSLKALILLSLKGFAEGQRPSEWEQLHLSDGPHHQVLRWAVIAASRRGQKGHTSDFFPRSVEDRTRLCEDWGCKPGLARYVKCWNRPVSLQNFVALRYDKHLPPFSYCKQEEKGGFCLHFSDAITEYCFDCKVRKLSPRSISNCQKQLRYLLSLHQRGWRCWKSSC